MSKGRSAPQDATEDATSPLSLTNMLIALVTSTSVLATIRGPRSESIHDPAAPLLDQLKHRALIETERTGEAKGEGRLPARSCRPVDAGA